MFPATYPPQALLSRPNNYGAHLAHTQTVTSFKIRAPTLTEDNTTVNGVSNMTTGLGDAAGEEEARQAVLREHLVRTEALIPFVFGKPIASSLALRQTAQSQNISGGSEALSERIGASKPVRAIDEDDYGDDDDGEDNDTVSSSVQQSKNTQSTQISGGFGKPKFPTFHGKPLIDRQSTNSSVEQARTSEEARKKLEQDKKAAEDAVKKSFYTMFYTLEADRDAMLEQQKLDELDRQVETEMSNQAGAGHGTHSGTQGTLSSANLGASSLTLKHLIALIDTVRDQVPATDAQLRTLMSEVRKNRSKWANEEKVGQEELYEAAEKVLMELKAMTEHAAPFLQRVNKREAPDYYSIIKHPMDIGTMIKKLKTLQYKSKKEFVDDLNLIWSNCLKYNADPAHFLRKKALYMRKETEKLVPLIPDIVVRDRAEVEAEERRLQNGDADLDGIEDSDDEEPIMASRGRMAHSAKGKKGSKGVATARKTAPKESNATPVGEVKPTLPLLNGVSSSLKHEFIRADSDAPMEGSVNGLSTPPLGNLTPLGLHGLHGSGAPGSQADNTEADVASTSGGISGQGEDPDLDDIEYKTWKQVTKKDRARVASERHRLFLGNRLNPDEPALLRTKAGMRRWLRQKRNALDEDENRDSEDATESKNDQNMTAGETLAEGIEEEQDERLLPDYYDSLSAIPDMDERLNWAEDADGQVIDHSEASLRMLPKQYFGTPESNLTKKMDANMRQVQDTRKICAKIGIVKQMQQQAQVYQNQFQKYDPKRLVDADAGPIVVSDEGPVMAQWACRAAFQRSIGKIFFHAGFEEFQPSALDAVTDIAGDFFFNLARAVGEYKDAPIVADEHMDQVNQPVKDGGRFSTEEAVLHSLNRIGLDVEGLEAYATEEVDRLAGKLSIMNDRMKSHLAELLRPALDSNAGVDGVGAFNDGSEQFVGGDFALEMDEDFFGFKELGLDKEYSLATLGVPLHLLQNRMHNAYQQQNASSSSVTGLVMDPPPPFEPITIHSVKAQIGLVQEFFLAKLHANDDEPLVEDEDLPVKQRYPKPRLPPTGKITSPRKRPPREAQQIARKKRKLEDGKEETNSGSTGTASANGPVKGLPKVVGKLRFDVPNSRDGVPDPEKDDGSVAAMISPESITA